MISLELAKKLKEAGLEWEPQEGDAYHDSASDTIYYSQYPPLESANYIRFTWLARLDQLLAEIRELGYKWFVETDTERYFIRVVEIKKPNNFHVIFSDSPANAAAEALLWIYEGRAATGCGLSDG